MLSQASGMRQQTGKPDSRQFLPV